MEVFRNPPAEDCPFSFIESQGLLERILELNVLELLGLGPGRREDDLSCPVHPRLHILLLVIGLTVVL